MGITINRPRKTSCNRNTKASTYNSETDSTKRTHDILLGTSWIKDRDESNSEEPYLDQLTTQNCDAKMKFINTQYPIMGKITKCDLIENPSCHNSMYMIVDQRQSSPVPKTANMHMYLKKSPNLNGRQFHFITKKSEIIPALHKAKC